MVLAISLIKVVPDQEKIAYRALRELKGVKNLYHIFGDHDFFLIMEAENVNDLSDLLNNIAGVRYVGEVKTILAKPAGSYAMDACSIKNALCPAA
ncbi:MAG: Lrp/AsnC ligand binding domain-containing protein [Methanotrichaceae archaeon]|nr:Lrp/AsnC ligand binding domain-containing protein [Methanotrichaceae archaeon]